ncbi:MAG: hypothetical protein ABH808_02185 [Candidatus Kuenenbacteria bacterium]
MKQKNKETKKHKDNKTFLHLFVILSFPRRRESSETQKNNINLDSSDGHRRNDKKMLFNKICFLKNIKKFQKNGNLSSKG